MDLLHHSFFDKDHKLHFNDATIMFHSLLCTSQLVLQQVPSIPPPFFLLSRVGYDMHLHICNATTCAFSSISLYSTIVAPQTF
jgi:hypothetical protein